MGKKVIHEIKLQKSVVVILAVLAVGVFAHAFAPVLSVNDAMAELTGGGFYTIDLTCTGCAYP